jgi:hypothetical protein
MRFGELVTFLADGVRIRPKSCEAIGIHDGSICWGVWAEDRKVGVDEPLPESSMYQGPHLIVTPIPLEAWPFVFKLQLELLHVKGSLAKASEIIRENGITILFAEGSPSGYRHATVTIIGRSLEVENRARRSKLAGEAKSLWVAQEMIRTVGALKRELLSQNSNPQFLHGSLAEQGFLNSFKKNEIGHKIWKENQDMITSAVEGHPLESLMYLSRCFDLGTLDVIEARYNKQRRLLEPVAGHGLRLEMKNAGLPLPSRAMAHFNTDEHFVRFQSIIPKSARPIYQIEVEYQAVPAEKSAPASSRGLIAAATGSFEACDIDINLMRVANVFKEMKRNEERGSVYFLASVEKEVDTSFEDELKSQIVSRLGPRCAIKIDEVRAVPLQNQRIFVSMKEESPRGEEIREFIRQSARSLGLLSEDVVSASTATQSVTPFVIDRMRECVGFIQVATGGDRESHWLCAEYGMAIALDLARVRIADRKSNIFKKLDADWKVFEIKEEMPASTLRQIVQRALEHLLSRLEDADDQIGRRRRR